LNKSVSQIQMRCCCVYNEAVRVVIISVCLTVSIYILIYSVKCIDLHGVKSRECLFVDKYVCQHCVLPKPQMELYCGDICTATTQKYSERCFATWFTWVMWVLSTGLSSVFLYQLKHAIIHCRGYQEHEDDEAPLGGE